MKDGAIYLVKDTCFVQVGVVGKRNELRNEVRYYPTYIATYLHTHELIGPDNTFE